MVGDVETAKSLGGFRRRRVSESVRVAQDAKSDAPCQRYRVLVEISIEAGRMVGYKNRWAMRTGENDVDLLSVQIRSVSGNNRLPVSI